MANYTSQDLQDNLDYLTETKKQIRQAIIDKGVDVPEDTPFRDYVKKIRSIVNYDEDLLATINEQNELIDTQTSTINDLENTIAEKEGMYTYFNIYCQELDPPSFVGLWFKKTLNYNGIVVVDDSDSNILKSTFEPNTVVLKDGHTYKTILYGPIPGYVDGNIGTCFDKAYITDDYGKIITNVEIYYGDGDENWIKI
jgi:hypothetical protein